MESYLCILRFLPLAMTLPSFETRQAPIGIPPSSNPSWASWIAISKNFWSSAEIGILSSRSDTYPRRLIRLTEGVCEQGRIGLGGSECCRFWDKISGGPADQVPFWNKTNLRRKFVLNLSKRDLNGSAKWIEFRVLDSAIVTTESATFKHNAIRMVHQFIHRIYREEAQYLRQTKKYAQFGSRTVLTDRWVESRGD